MLLRGVAVNVLDCDIVVSEFELKSRFSVHFQTNALGEGKNLLNLHPAVGLILPLLFFFMNDFGIKYA